MTQDLTRPKTRQTHHILIIDDSARLRQTLTDLIVSNCLATGKIFKVFHSDKEGKYTQSSEVPRPGMVQQDEVSPKQSEVIDEFTIYTAPSPKQALFVINSPVFSRLTIVSDVMMPADTEVGLIGMLEAIARRNLPVNLVFASSDAQNSFVVAKLVESGKAYFMVKQGSAWEDLSRALVQRAGAFRYKAITSLDFQGMQKITGLSMRTSYTAPLPESPVPVEPEDPNHGLFSSNTSASQGQQSKIKPPTTLNQLPRIDNVPTPNKSLEPEPTRSANPPVSSVGQKTPSVPVKPELPPVTAPVNPGLKMPQSLTPSEPIRYNQTEAPRIEGFMPVTPTTPHFKTNVPPMPAWEETVVPPKPEPAPKSEEVIELEVRALNNLANTGLSNPGESRANATEPEAVNTLPTQTQTRLSQYADTGKKEKKVFVLFRPFIALTKRFRKKRMFTKY